MTRRHLTVTAAAAAALFALAGCSSESSPSAPDSSAPPTATDPQGTEAPPNTGDDDDLANYKPQLSWDDAIKKAQQEADGKVSDIELEITKDGSMRYGIDVLAGSKKTELTLDAKTGKVLSTDSDSAGGQQPLELDSYIGVDEAKSSALDVLPGKVNRIHLARDAKTAAYTLTIAPEKDAEAYEVRVDAKTGKAHRSDD